VASKVYIGYVNGEMASFLAVMPQPGIVNGLWRIHRTVVLPDFQGLGLSNRMAEWCGERLDKEGKIMSIVTTHPGLIKSYIKSDRWRLRDMKKGVTLGTSMNKNELSKRLKASFYYVPLEKNKNDFDFLWNE